MRLPLLPLCPYASYVLGFGFFALVSRRAALSPPLAPRCLLPLPSAVSVTHATTPDTLRRLRAPCPSAVSVCRVRLPPPPRTRHPAPSPSAVSVCRVRLPTPPRTRHRAPCPSAAGSCGRLLRQAHAAGTKIMFDRFYFCLYLLPSSFKVATASLPYLTIRLDDMWRMPLVVAMHHAPMVTCQRSLANVPAPMVTR